MLMFSRALLVFALLAASTLARSDGIFNPGSRGIGFTDGIFNGGVPIPQPTGKILLADGVSFILQTDAVSKICRAGGC
jgi:hypothetical protein